MKSKPSVLFKFSGCVIPDSKAIINHIGIVLPVPR